MNRAGKALAILLGWLAFAGHAHDLKQPLAPSNTPNEIITPELVVTGEKIPRPLQKTFTSVSLATARSISDQDVADVYDVLAQTPNIAVEGNRTSFSIRGVDAFNVSGGGDGPLASLYVDGVAIPRLAMAAGPISLFDVSQVEVLRGPQSTIQGRNSLAGAVIVNTAHPSHNWRSDALLKISDRDGAWETGLALGGPIIDEQLAFRLAAQASSADGFIDNITTNEDGNKQAARTFRGKLLVEPLSAPNLRIMVNVLYDRHQRGTFYTEFDAPYEPRDRVTTADMQDRKVGTSLITGLTASYKISPNMSLFTTSSYSRIGFESASDADRTAARGQVGRLKDDTVGRQGEARLTLKGPWVSGLVGAYYLREQRHYIYNAMQNLSLGSLGLDQQLRSAGLSPAMIEAVFDLYGRSLPISNNSMLRRDITNVAAFADLTFLLNARLELHAGLRYDNETQNRWVSQTVAIRQPLPDPAHLPAATLSPIVNRVNGFLDTLARNASRTDPTATATYDAWLPRLGVTYVASGDLRLTFTVQRGYRAGGTGFNEQRAEIYSFAPEYVTNYEAALRSQWLNRRLTINLNIYRTDWKHQQLPVQLTPGALFDTQVVNVGRSRLNGFEAEARALAMKGLSLHAGIGYSDARFNQFNLPVGSLRVEAQGKAFPLSPKWTLSGGATFSQSEGLLASFYVNHRSGYYQTVTDQSRHDISGLTLVNAKLGWKWQRFDASLTISNILDIQKPDQFIRDIDGRRRGTLSDPRVVKLTLGSRF